MRNTALLAAILSVGAFAGFYWWFHPSWPIMLAYLLVATVATLSVPLLYRVAGFTLADEVEWLASREAKDHIELQTRLVSLRKELQALDIQEAVQQADTLTAILDDYHAVVETRFIGKKHSPMAYLSAARRVQKQALQNLTDIVAVGHSLSSISRQDAVDERLVRLQDLNKEQSARLEDLLEHNRSLFAALTDTAVEVANIRSYSDYERLDTLARLVSLAEIANKTGK